MSSSLVDIIMFVAYVDGIFFYFYTYDQKTTKPTEKRKQKRQEDIDIVCQ